jgi:hypothetical protein
MDEPLLRHHLVESADVEERLIGIDRPHRLAQCLPRPGRAGASARSAPSRSSM